MPKITLANGKEVEISQESYDALSKAVQEKRWKPELHKSYYYIDDGGMILRPFWANDYIDNFRYSQRNVFKTKEEAEKHLEYLQTLAILKDDAEGWEPDWSDGNERKWYVLYTPNESLTLDWANDGKVAGVIYFETEEQAQHSIDTHEKEWLTVFGVER